MYTGPTKISNNLEPKAFKTDDTHYILVEDYSYTWKLPAENIDTGQTTTLVTTIKVKSGFRWDGASVPKILWKWGFKPDGPHRSAALIHDFIYIHKGKLPEGSIVASYSNIESQIQHGSFSRKDADRLFGKIMKEACVPPFKRTLMKWAVTIFGWNYWEDGTDVFRKSIIKSIIILLGLLGLFEIIFGF